LQRLHLCLLQDREEGRQGTLQKGRHVRSVLLPEGCGITVGSQSARAAKAKKKKGVCDLFLLKFLKIMSLQK
jgi:hypothetical protein